MLSKPSKDCELRQRNHARSSRLILTATTTTIIDVVINPSLIGITTLAISTLGTSAIFFRRELDGLFNTIAKFSGKYKITSSALTVLGAFLLLDALSTTAQAQFFQNAETWMTEQFTGAQEAITLSFNVLRGLFILYLGISLVRVIQAARQDEDWQNLARTPMIILIAVTMGDILANLIIGGGTGT
ncbi:MULTISPECIES: hypothetical protein [unclassified Tolypothrix]|uniref:hypothetical protein n=1 Tax=unclassified Tolypothrix TaxID=2649714 RepID=UPI0005EAA921|nr:MULTISPECIES: hypothetical protein [unclassified Tolypothrix]BAY93641.1 hypothetical protein NIES3275_56830 [Microchaete diplosiphon NIES-3275]EKE99559.1 hypothetical protein FDUTEX481_09819 [Tolypothrix sp. PCC 7601]MBE9081694.1 hypothetical protein [Tolypothrix sp. LEGE 11397]UYD27461.1 hypothetical protein HGR01_05070 [Tolypothrix sp. PCC 7712]UYD36675.1 hypothetical protein HG267_13640 [Tolypothrix sp. PCC 7601]